MSVSLQIRLNGERHLLEQHGEKILACCYISPAVNKPVHMKNEIRTTNKYKDLPGEVATLKKKKNKKNSIVEMFLTNFWVPSICFLVPLTGPVPAVEKYCVRRLSSSIILLCFNDLLCSY